MRTRRFIPAVWIAALGAISLPVLAQSTTNASAGPVHLPADYATNAPVKVSIAPAALLAGPAPSTNAPSASGPVAAVPSGTGTATHDDDSGDIHDIQGVMPVPYPMQWLFYTLGGLVLAGLLYAAWRWLRRTVIKPKLPHELALERLESARRLMNEGQVREYAFAVSEIIRSYIEQRFGERARRRTTEEFLSGLLRQTGTPLAEHMALLEDFLNHCDLLKFARWEFSIPEMESMHESARTFIVKTSPGYQAPAPAAVAQPQTVSVP
jgi:hypothetical protein